MKKKISVYCDYELLEMIECATDYNFINRSSFISIVLADYFKNHPEIFERCSY